MGKSLTLKIVRVGICIVHLLFPISFVYALPSDENIVTGEASFDRSEDQTTLNVTASDQSIIEWGTFNIAQNESVNFFLPTADAYSLNRIVSGGTSQILGILTANGNLVLVNSNGFYFGSEANVSAGGLMVSTHDISNADFLAGRYIFTGLGDTVASSQSSILNEGFIQANEGDVVLIGDAIENHGLISAPLGTVALAAGNLITVSISSSGLAIAIDEKTAHQIVDKDGNPITEQIKNTGTLAAEGGKVLLNAQAVDQLFESAINAQGVIRAGEVVVGEDGAIEIVASGDIHASAQMSADQGQILISSDEDILVEGGVYEAQGGSVQFNAGGELTVTSEVATKGETSFEAKENVRVNADVTTDAGNLTFQADSDLNGAGAFLQAADTTIKTTTSGDITLSSSGESTIANVIAAGDLILEKAGAAVRYVQQAGSTVTTGGSLRIGAGVTLAAANTLYEIARDWVNLGIFDAVLSHVKLVGIETATVYGSNTFNDFTVIQAGKTVEFQAGAEQEIIGILTLQGGFGSPLALRSTKVGVPWKIDAVGATTLTYLDVMDSTNVNIHGPPPAPTMSKNSGNNTGWDFSEAGPVWIGGSSSNWSDELNWNGGFLPGEFDVVRFDSRSTSYDPRATVDALFGGTVAELILESSYNGTVILERNLTITGDLVIAGGTLSANSSILTLHSSLLVTGGTFNPGTSTVVFNDASKTSTISGDNTFYNLTSYGADKVILFEAGKLQTIQGSLNLQGAYAHLLKIHSTVEGEQYLIDIQGGYSLDFVDVRDSSQLGGDMVLITRSHSDGNISGWIADPDWTGDGADNLASTNLNWDSGVAPGAGNTVTFNGTAGGFPDKNATWNIASVGSFTIGAGYTGIITVDVATNPNFTSTWTMNGGTFDINGRTMTVTGAFSQTAGTFNSTGGGTLDLNSSFSLSGTGTFNAPTQMNVFGAFTHTAAGAAFNEGTGITFDGGFATIDVDVTETFNNVTMNMIAGNPITITSGDTLVVTGTLTLTEGLVNTGTIDARGAINQASTFDGGTAFLDFGDNAVAQTYTINGGAGPVLRFDNASDVNDSVVFNATATLYGLSITAGFGDANTVPFTYNGFDLTIGGATGTAAIFNQASGIFNAPTNITFSAFTNTIFTKSGGTYNEGTNTTFLGSNGTYDVVTTETFTNVTINMTGGSPITITSGDTMVVTGTLTLTEGLVNTGTIDARGAINQASTFDGGTAFLDFGDNAVAQTYTINGGAGPVLRFDNASDVNDSVVFNATATLYGLSITAGFGDANTVPFTYNGFDLTIGSNVAAATAIFNQASGIFNAPTNITFSGAVNTIFTKSGGTYNEGTNTTFLGSNATYDVVTTETFTNVTINMTDGAPITITSGDTMVVTGTLTLTNGLVNTGTINAQGNVTVASTFDGGTGPLLFSGSATQSFDLTGATGLFNADISVNKSGGQVNLLSALVMDAASQDLILIEGTFNLNGNALTVNGASSTLVVQDGGNLQLQGAEAVTVLGGNPQLLSGSTVTFTGDGDSILDTYTITNLSTTYYHLTVNSTDAIDIYQLGAAATMDGTLTVTSGILSLNGNNISDTPGGDIAVRGNIAGTIRLQGVETVFWTTNDTDSGTWEYVGTAAQCGAGCTVKDFGTPDYFNLTINGTGTFNHTSALDVDGNLTISVGTLNSGGNNINLAGNWTNNATYTSGANTVTLDGGDQTILGSTTFNNLVKTVTVQRTLTFDDTGTQVVLGTLQLEGADTSNRLLLRSDNPGTQWQIDPQGTRTVSFLNVQDSNNTNAAAISCTNGCVDSLRNTRWSFSNASSGGSPAASTESINAVITTIISQIMSSFSDFLVPSVYAESSSVDISTAETAASSGQSSTSSPQGTSAQTAGSGSKDYSSLNDFLFHDAKVWVEFGTGRVAEQIVSQTSVIDGEIVTALSYQDARGNLTWEEVNLKTGEQATVAGLKKPAVLSGKSFQSKQSAAQYFFEDPGVWDSFGSNMVAKHTTTSTAVTEGKIVTSSNYRNEQGKWVSQSVLLEAGEQSTVAGLEKPSVLSGKSFQSEQSAAQYFKDYSSLNDFLFHDAKVWVEFGTGRVAEQIVSQTSVIDGEIVTALSYQDARGNLTWEEVNLKTGEQATVAGLKKPAVLSGKSFQSKQSAAQYFFEDPGVWDSFGSNMVAKHTTTSTAVTEGKIVTSSNYRDEEGKWVRQDVSLEAGEKTEIKGVETPSAPSYLAFDGVMECENSGAKKATCLAKLSKSENKRS